MNPRLTPKRGSRIMKAMKATGAAGVLERPGVRARVLESVATTVFEFRIPNGHLDPKTNPDAPS